MEPGRGDWAWGLFGINFLGLPKPPTPNSLEIWDVWCRSSKSSWFSCVSLSNYVEKICFPCCDISPATLIHGTLAVTTRAASILITASDTNEKTVCWIPVTEFLERARVFIIAALCSLLASGRDPAKEWKNTVRKVALLVFLAWLNTGSTAISEQSKCTYYPGSLQMGPTIGQSDVYSKAWILSWNYWPT